MIINIPHKNGLILKTSGKYCREDILVAPTNQIKQVTENGTYTSDDGYSGLSDVVVNVQPELEERAIEIVENGVTEITTAENYYGMSKISVMVNVPIHDEYINAEGVSF